MKDSSLRNEQAHALAQRAHGIIQVMGKSMESLNAELHLSLASMLRGLAEAADTAEQQILQRIPLEAELRQQVYDRYRHILSRELKAPSEAERRLVSPQDSDQVISLEAYRQNRLRHSRPDNATPASTPLRQS